MMLDLSESHNNLSGPYLGGANDERNGAVGVAHGDGVPSRHHDLVEDDGGFPAGLG